MCTLSYPLSVHFEYLSFTLCTLSYRTSLSLHFEYTLCTLPTLSYPLSVHFPSFT